jgi:hypothetical protein
VFWLTDDEDISVVCSKAAHKNSQGNSFDSCVRNPEARTEFNHTTGGLCLFILANSCE